MEERTIDIGLLADIQYCPCERSGARDYAGSLAKLREAADFLNREKVDFTVGLGDFIDRDFNSFGPVARTLDVLQSEWVFVPGNHDFAVSDSLKRLVWEMIRDDKGYRSEVRDGFRFLYLNGLVNSTVAYPSGTSKYRKNRDKLDQLAQAGAANAADWNGGLGSRQIRWIAGQIRQAAKNGEKLVLFCHQPAVPGEPHSLWDSRELLAVLAGYPGMVLYLCGHNHSGGDHKLSNTRIINLKGMVEQVNPAGAILRLNSAGWTLDGFGGQRTLSGNWLPAIRTSGDK